MVYDHYERQPLLGGEHVRNYSQEARSLYHGSTECITSRPPPPPQNSVTTSPPPQNTGDGGETILCRVCTSRIDISGEMRSNQWVAKCDGCKEATPVRKPPHGRKYVYCPCNCLLVCKSTSNFIACPRQNCRRVINLAPLPPSFGPHLEDSGVSVQVWSVTCAYCGDTFLFTSPNHHSLVKCPHCRSVSSLSSRGVKTKSTLFLVLGLIMLCISLSLTAVIIYWFKDKPWMFPVLGVCFLMAVLLLLASGYFYTRKVSRMERLGD